jgi:hypothetical protein
MNYTGLFRRAILAFCITAIMSPLGAQSHTELKFRADKTFRILQFTDIHWDNKSKGCAVTAETIRSVITEEKPDLIIITGDVVTDAPPLEGWDAVSEIFAGEKMPWTITLGNHDGETGISRDKIFEILSTRPFFIGSKGPALTGCGNYTLTVKSSDGRKNAAIIYCIDSNDYPKTAKVGSYDWIHIDQIEWYRKTSDTYTRKNKGIPLPALAFFHIPLPEFADIIGKKGTIGPANEGVASPLINSGLFASMVEKQDVMGIFVGHDHDDNYCGIKENICLAYGRVTGNDAYGSLERGGRVIELHEDEFSFDTWVRTPSGKSLGYNYPSGLETEPEAVDYLPSTEIKGLKQGVNYKYYEGHFSSVDRIESSKVIKSGVMKGISIDDAAAADSFAYVFDSYIKIPKTAVYRFYTYSDDGSKLFIDGKLVVNNDGSHGSERADGTIALAEGFHEFKLLYFEDYSGSKLEAGISSIAVRECRIPDNWFFRE